MNKNVEYSIKKHSNQVVKGKYNELIQSYNSSSVCPSFWLSIIDGDKNGLCIGEYNDLVEVSVLLGLTEAKQLVLLLQKEIESLEENY